MKPKAKKFRIRRTIGGASGAVRPNQANEAGYDEDDFDDDEQEQQPERLNRLSPDSESFLTPAEEIEKIKAENLTGRQLRIARREAQNTVSMRRRIWMQCGCCVKMVLIPLSAAICWNSSCQIKARGLPICRRQSAMLHRLRRMFWTQIRVRRKSQKSSVIWLADAAAVRCCC